MQLEKRTKVKRTSCKQATEWLPERKVGRRRVGKSDHTRHPLNHHTPLKLISYRMHTRSTQARQSCANISMKFWGPRQGCNNRRKFRKSNFRQYGQTGRVREEKRRRENQRRERVRRKKMQVREKVEKSRFTVFFPTDLWLRRVEK